MLDYGNVKSGRAHSTAQFASVQLCLYWLGQHWTVRACVRACGCVRLCKCTQIINYLISHFKVVFFLQSLHFCSKGVVLHWCTFIVNLQTVSDILLQGLGFFRLNAVMLSLFIFVAKNDSFNTVHPYWTDKHLKILSFASFTSATSLTVFLLISLWNLKYFAKLVMTVPPDGPLDWPELAAGRPVAAAVADPPVLRLKFSLLLL